jgi:hypothetical protein
MENKNQKNISTEEKEREEKYVELPIIEFFLINLISFLVPLYICLSIFLVLEYSIIYFFSFNLLINLTIFVFLLVILHFVYIIVIIEFSAYWVRVWNKKQPPKQGIFQRVLDDQTSEEGKVLKYYHRRGFIIKFPLWLSSKSPFPWLLNRVLRKIGHNIIEKNVIFCDSFPGLEFTKLHKNVFLFPTSAISSHAVNSIFGKISIMEIILGENTVFYPCVIAGPDARTKENYVIYPLSVVHKSWRGIGEMKYYTGEPAKPFQ